MNMIIIVLVIQSLLILDRASGGSVDCDCGTKETGALLTYKGDPQAVLAINKSGSVCWFDENTADASYTRKIYYESDNEDDCVFEKHPTMDTYSTTVQGRMTFKDFENAGDEEFFIECNYETYADDAAGSTSVIEEPVKTVKVVHVDKGGVSNSTFNLTMVKIDKGPLEPPIKLGRMMRLKITMNPVGNDSDFRVTSCTAESPTSDKTASILAQGCGTGFPFPEGKGFVKEGLVAFSPPFRAFVVKRRDSSVDFRCNFIICDDCGQSSCEEENEEIEGSSETERRRKRRTIDSLLREEIDVGNFLSSESDPSWIERQQNQSRFKGLKIAKSETDPFLVTAEDSPLPDENEIISQEDGEQNIKTTLNRKTSNGVKRVLVSSETLVLEGNEAGISTRMQGNGRGSVTKISSKVDEGNSVGSMMLSNLRHLVSDDKHPLPSSEDITLLLLLTSFAFLLISIVTSVISAYFILKKVNRVFRNEVANLKTISVKAELDDKSDEDKGKET